MQRKRNIRSSLPENRETQENAGRRIVNYRIYILWKNFMVIIGKWFVVNLLNMIIYILSILRPGSKNTNQDLSCHITHGYIL